MLSATETAANLPAETPVEIVDIHHVQKKDAPSGTAMLLAHAIAAARDQQIEECLHISDAPSDSELAPGSISCVSLREGEIIGEHRVRFFCAGEQVVLSHSASDRRIYATGAVEAGLWLIRQGAGLYSAANWLGA
jgi:4-hydroxy-tetrahydrodipicolinate reductase